MGEELFDLLGAPRMSARRIKAIAAAAVALGIGTLITACGSNDDTPVVQSTWQITNVYVDEQHPSVLPDSIAGKATMVFGESTIAGNSGCAPFQTRVNFTKDGQETSSAEATQVDFYRKKIDDPTGCTGADLYYHDSLTNMLDGTFDVQRKAANELLLVKQTDVFNRPAIRLTSISNRS